MMKFIGIIPARYASTRFPGKPLADMNGKPMIQRVYEQVKDVLDSVCVATDDIRIENAVKAFGGQVVMTSDQHRSGTDRCYEAYQKIGEGYDVIVNIQGDEPFIHPEQIQTIKTCFADANTQIATLVKPFRSDDDFESTLFNPNSPKVVLNKTTRLCISVDLLFLISGARNIRNGCRVIPFTSISGYMPIVRKC